jgi:hypothetical protein
MEMEFIQIVGTWVSIFMTIAVLSFLFDDNPIYKFAEHVFMGISIGYGVVETYWNLFKPNLFDKLLGDTFQPLYLVPLVLAILLMFKISRKHAWLARIPIAILVSAYAAVKITGETSGKLIRQVGASFPDVSNSWNTHGLWSWSADGAGVFSDAFLVIALSACLIHFYFSEITPRAQRLGVPLGSIAFVGVTALVLMMSPVEDTLGRVITSVALGLCVAAPFLTLSPYKHLLTRFGVMVLMVSFGASFGFTVMGRISLAIGRGQELMGLNKSVEEVAQTHPQIATTICILVVSACLYYWHRQSPEEE